MTTRRTAIAAFILVAAAAAILLAMGRNPICTCGEIDLWIAARDSPRTSQMLADWYSLSHVVHGLLFYAALWLIARRWPAQALFIVALLIESAWEVFENTPFVIDRYRETTAARCKGASPRRFTAECLWRQFVPLSRPPATLGRPHLAPATSRR